MDSVLGLFYGTASNSALQSVPAARNLNVYDWSCQKLAQSTVDDVVDIMYNDMRDKAKSRTEPTAVRKRHSLIVWLCFEMFRRSTSELQKCRGQNLSMRGCLYAASWPFALNISTGEDIGQPLLQVRWSELSRHQEEHLQQDAAAVQCRSLCNDAMLWCCCYWLFLAPIGRKRASNRILSPL